MPSFSNLHVLVGYLMHDFRFDGPKRCGVRCRLYERRYLGIPVAHCHCDCDTWNDADARRALEYVSIRDRFHDGRLLVKGSMLKYLVPFMLVALLGAAPSPVPSPRPSIQASTAPINPLQEESQQIAGYCAREGGVFTGKISRPSAYPHSFFPSSIACSNGSFQIILRWHPLPKQTPVPEITP